VPAAPLNPVNTEFTGTQPGQRHIERVAVAPGRSLRRLRGQVSSWPES
jgi:hypothetical protein